MDPNLLQAIELALAGQWDAAHEMVQDYDADPTAAWIHAVLHKIEGDHGNSQYWYRRAGKPMPAGSSEAEWAAILEALLRR